MDIKVGLVIFDGQNILLEKRGNIWAIPESELPPYRTSLYIVNEILGKTTYVTGRWAEVELGLVQIGVFDDLDRNPDCRELMIAYSLTFPGSTSIKEGYEWVKISEMN